MAESAPLIPVPNHPGIYRKGNRYVVVFRYRGRQRKKSFRTLTEASTFKAKSHLGEAPQASSRMLFVAYAETWLPSYTGRTCNGLQPTTRDAYEDIISRIVLPYFKREMPTLRLGEMSPKDLKDFIAHLARQGWAAATVRRYYTPLRAMLATAAEDGLISRNPAAGLRVVVPQRAPDKDGGEASGSSGDESNGGRSVKLKRLSPEQTKALLAEIPAEHSDLVFLLASTGLRINEALSLRWRDLGHGGDAGNSGDKPPDHGGAPVLVISESKTAAGLRTLALSPATSRRLIKRRATVEHNGPADFIFASMVGTKINDHNWRQRVFRPAAERAGIPSATPHRLRHGLASLMAEQGYSAGQIASQLGHADNGVVAQRWYIHSKPIQAPDFIDQAFSDEASGA